MATAGSRRSGAAQAIARAAETPMIMLNAPLVGNRLGYPDLSTASTCWSCSPSSIRRASRCRRPRAWPTRSASTAPEGERGGGRLPARRRRRGCSTRWRRTGRSARAPGRRRRRSTGCAGPGPARSPSGSPRPERDERWLFSPPARMGGERRPAAAAAGPARPRRRPSTGSKRWSASGAEVARRPARLCRRRRRRLRSAPRSRTSPICCSPRPAPGSARRWAISRRPRSGRQKADGAVWVSTYTKALQRQLDREGARLFPDAAERKAPDRDPQGPRELSLPAQPGGCAAGRLRRPRRDPRPAGRALGRLYARTATWSAATCRAG